MSSEELSRPRPTRIDNVDTKDSISEAPEEFKKELLRHRDSLLRFALTLTRNKATAEDMVQTTFLKALTKWEQFTPGSNMGAWLFIILRNSYYAQLKKTRREVPDSDGKFVNHLEAPLPYEEEGIENLPEQLRLMNALIEYLPKSQGDVLMAQMEFREKPQVIDAIAAKLHMSPGTIKNCIFRTRMSLKAMQLLLEGVSKKDVLERMGGNGPRNRQALKKAEKAVLKLSTVVS